MATARPRSATLTDLDRRILEELRANARLSFRVLAKRLGVSTPTVSKRVQRMERAGIIQGYTVLTPELPPAPLTGPDVLTCTHCKNPIEGPPRIRHVQEETRVFCCDHCADAWTERRQRASPSPGASLVVFVVLGPVFSFGFLIFACSAASCVTAMPAHREFGACAPWTERSFAGPLSTLGRAATRPTAIHGRRRRMERFPGSPKGAHAHPCDRRGDRD